MTLFLMTFFLLYTMMHLFVFLKAKTALSPGFYARIMLITLMSVMVVAPVLVRLAEREGYEMASRILAYTGYLWLGGIFLFFSMLLAMDLYRLFIYLGELALQKDLGRLVIPTKHAFLTALCASLLIVVYGYFEAANIRTEHIVIKTPEFPVNSGKLRIAQISDVHLGLIVKEGRLRRILEAVKQANPDILVSTGDLVDGQMDKLDGLSDLLKQITPKYGKYAVTGNHEFYAGFEQSKHFTEKAGFTLLREEMVTIEEWLNIAGVDDPVGHRLGLSKHITEKQLLSGAALNTFTLLLKHRPLVDSNAVGLFHLQLSGHVHKGQIFPFSVLTGIYYPTQSGLVRQGEESLLYVSRGSGTWGPPIRVLSPPEVTIIDILHSDN